MAANIDSVDACDAEDVQKANNELLEAKKLINRVRRDNLNVIRQLDLDNMVEFFNTRLKPHAQPAEIHTYENLVKTAQRSIDRGDTDFDNILESLRIKNTVILFRQDWFVIDWYKRMVASPSGYLDQTRYRELKRMGDQAVAAGSIDQLRAILAELTSIRIHAASDENMFDIANIIKG